MRLRSYSQPTFCAARIPWNVCACVSSCPSACWQLTAPSADTVGADRLLSTCIIVALVQKFGEDAICRGRCNGCRLIMMLRLRRLDSWWWVLVAVEGRDIWWRRYAGTVMVIYL